MEAEFVISGKPVGKQRPRNNGNHFYTPQKTKDYENHVRECYRNQVENVFFESGVQAYIYVYITLPNSYSKKRKSELLWRGASVKPDLDNVAKSILDALNGVAYKDDKQVNTLCISRIYGLEDEIMVRLCEPQKGE